MFIRQENTIINTAILPVIILQGTDIRFQDSTDFKSAYIKLKFKTRTLADTAYNLIFLNMSEEEGAIDLQGIDL